MYLIQKGNFHLSRKRHSHIAQEACNFWRREGHWEKTLVSRNLCSLGLVESPIGSMPEQKFRVPWVPRALWWGFWVALQTYSVSGIVAILILSFCRCVLTPASKGESRASPKMPLIIVSKGVLSWPQNSWGSWRSILPFFCWPGTPGLL